MRALTRVLMFIILFCTAQVAFGQEGQTRPRKYKATYELPMYEAPDFHSKKVGKLKEGVIVEALADSKPGTPGGYVQVAYKNKVGWVMKVELQRHMDVPAAEMVCFSNGYKIIRDVYRYFFACRNDGVLPYAGPLTVRLFDTQDKVSFEKTVSFSDSPIPPGGGGPFYFDLAAEAPRFEAVHQTGTNKGTTGKLIERVP
jgi:hypothetical protein